MILTWKIKLIKQSCLSIDKLLTRSNPNPVYASHTSQISSLQSHLLKCLPGHYWERKRSKIRGWECTPHQISALPNTTGRRKRTEIRGKACQSHQALLAWAQLFPTPDFRRRFHFNLDHFFLVSCARFFLLVLYIVPDFFFMMSARRGPRKALRVSP